MSPMVASGSYRGAPALLAGGVAFWCGGAGVGPREVEATGAATEPSWAVDALADCAAAIVAPDRGEILGESERRGGDEVIK